MTTTTQDYYQVLGVGKNASAEEIQRAYRRLARRYHPDVNKDAGAEEMFKQVTEAYDVLSDPDTRARYDRFGAAWRQVPPDYDPTSAGFGGGFRTGDGGRGQRVYVDGDAAGFDAAGIDLEDLLGGIFGGRGGGFGRGPVVGADSAAHIELSLEDAYSGGRRQITLTTPSGPRTYDVNIPAGVTDGQRIRLAGQGEPGSGGGSAGDLYLVVHIAPHPRFRVEGRNIHVDLPVTPWEAALGATVPVETPGGTAQVTVPPGSSTARKLRLRGRGMPNPKGAPGDVYAEVRVMVPSTLSDRERSLFQQLAEASSFDPRRETRRSA